MPTSNGAAALARPPSLQGRRRRYVWLRSWNQLHLWLGPVLTIAVLVAVGVMVLSIVVIGITERHNPNYRSGWSAFRWITLAMIASPPWRVTTPAGRVVHVLADSSLGDRGVDEMDSKALMTTLAIESSNPNCYTCVEVIMGRNREHFSRTKADELVVSGHLTGALLAHSAVTHGLATVVGELLTFPSGNEFYWVSVPPILVGKRYHDALGLMKERYDCLLVAIAQDGKGYHTNPRADEVLKDGDRLLLIAERPPDI
jgi:hypothetical protein